MIVGTVRCSECPRTHSGDVVTAVSVCTNVPGAYYITPRPCGAQCVFGQNLRPLNDPDNASERGDLKVTDTPRKRERQQPRKVTT
jgi:hypothetical protein